MKVECRQVEIYTIYGAPGLDAITFILQDFKIGTGRLIVECYGRSWANYWGSMGKSKIRDFLLQCDEEYIASKLLHYGRKVIKKDELYLIKIVKAVKEALKYSPENQANE